MENERSTWIMYGVDWDDPECIHSVEEAIEYINEVGFLPLFKNEIPGFSLEERTVSEYWWTGNPEQDPWEWRAVIASSGEVAYGKFFDQKAGFISKKWLPYFVNYRRDGYDFDALWEDEKASIRQKKIMDLFAEENSEMEYFSSEIKKKAGFGKEGEKGFDSTITNLQMMTYLCVRDFRQKRNKRGQPYGWAMAVYATPEHIFGSEQVISAYCEDPIESGKRIAMHLRDIYPIASAAQIKKLIGTKVGDIIEKKKTTKNTIEKTEYPQNLLKALKLEIQNPTVDQKIGVEFALGQLRESFQEVVQLRFEKGLTYKEIGEQLGKSSSRCGQLCNIAIKRIQNPKKIVWIIEGYQGHLDKLNQQVEEIRQQFIAEGKTKQANLLFQSPDVLKGITAKYAKLLVNCGICNIGMLREAMKEDFWSRSIEGIGTVSNEKLVLSMYRAEMIDESFEAYKELMYKEYRFEKIKKMREV